MLLGLIITLAIVAGQLIKLPVFSGGVSMLDLIIIVSTLLGIYKLKFKFEKPPLFIVTAFIFILISSISLVFTPLKLSTQEYINSSFYIVRFAFYILFAYVIYSKAFPSFQSSIQNSLIYAGVSLSVLGILQFIFIPDLNFLTSVGWDPHYFRTVSTFLDPNFSGAFFVLTLILLLANPKKDRNFKLMFIAVFIALLTTFSRSSYLMFLISGISLAFLKKSKNLIGLVILLFLILLSTFWIYTQLISKPRNIDREQSASLRLNTWQQGAQLFQSHPILGVGFNTYRFALKEYELGDAQFLNSHGGSSNDSSLLFVAATTGIIGFVSYLGFLIYLIKRRSVILTSSIMGLLIHSIFANSLFFPPILLWLIIISLVPKK